MNDLYQDHILDHANNPRNKVVTKPNATPSPSLSPRGEEKYICGEGDNPSCGDSGIMCVYIYKNEEIKEISNSDKIKKVEWSGVGCAISQASMSMMSEYIIGRSLSDLKLLMPGDVYAMLGIQITPSRVNCALLPYRAIEKIVENWIK